MSEPFDDATEMRLAADSIRLLREARRILREDESEARANLPYSQRFLDFLAEVDEHLRRVALDELTRMAEEDGHYV